MEDRMVFSTAPDSLLASKTYIKVADLKNYTFISHERQSQLFQQTQRFIIQHNLPSEITMTFNNIDAIKQAVEADLGISFLPHSAVRNELHLGLIREIFLENLSWSYPQSLIYNKKRHQSPASLKMMEIVKGAIGDMFPGTV